jgi:hypothetical protein
VVILSDARIAQIRVRAHGWTARWLAALLLVIPAKLRSGEPSAPLKEYQIKALFLYNFAQFVEWPANAFPSAETPITIGVLGDDPFGSDLDAIVQGDRSGNRALKVRRFQRVEEIDGCHILFISQTESSRLEQILSVLKGRSILTVGDAEGFSLRGGMIRFVTENKKVRMRINLDAAKRAGLTLSSKLLRPAEIVTDRKS